MTSKRRLHLIIFCLMITLLCSTKPAAAKKVELTLYATDGFITMPDGKRVYVWGFTDDPEGNATIPSPTIEVDEGDDVYLTLINKMMLQAIPPNHEPHTIHLHGITLPTEFDGVPQLSFPVGARYTYYFKADNPGTYMYHCHVQAPKHIHMGMYGALIVRPKKGPDYVYNDKTTGFDKEYTFILSELDTRWSDDVYNGGGVRFNPVDYKPDYWLINGLAFPDTLKNEGTFIKTKVGEKVLLRLINIGMEMHSIHLHGAFMLIVGRDATRLEHPQRVYTVTVGPGESYDIIIEYPDLAKISPVYEKYMKYPQKYIIHDHMDYKVTNNGEYPGGMLTYIEVGAP